MINPKVFFDISIGNSKTKKIIFELFAKECPKTSENFLKLCTGELKNVKINNKEILMSYKNSIFHRIIPGFMAQGGDFTNFNGTGGISIYGERFNDENFIYKHKEKGLLSMANSGPNTNGSQFFLTFIECPWLDGKHTVFGKTIEGIDLLNDLEKVGTQSGKTLKEVKIIDCGKIN